MGIVWLSTLVQCFRDPSCDSRGSRPCVASRENGDRIESDAIFETLCLPESRPTPRVAVDTEAKPYRLRSFVVWMVSGPRGSRKFGEHFVKFSLRQRVSALRI